MAKNQIQLFEDKRIRTSWNEKDEKWYFSIVDIVAVLTDSTNPKEYLKKLRIRDAELNSNWGTICTPLRMKALDGKSRTIQTADMEHSLRIIQSIPSPKAEPFKQWMAHVAALRIDQAQDPELSINQAMEDYGRLGYSESWINQRLQGIEYRKGLTDEWKRSGITEHQQYASLTDIMTQTWSGLHIREYKKKKGIYKTKRNLRDNMTNTELVLNSLAEVAATELSKKENPKGYKETEKVAVKGSSVAKAARKNLEQQLGHSVISSDNADDLRLSANHSKEIEAPKP